MVLGWRWFGVAVAAESPGLKLRQVIFPEDVLVLAQLVEIVPGIDAGTVAIAEDRADGVIAHLLDLGDQDFTLAILQHGLVGRMALHLGRGRVDAQELEAEAEGGAVTEVHTQLARALVDNDVGGKRGILGQASHDDGIATPGC